MMACPFGIPRYEWDKVWAPKVKKCTMCAPVSHGLQPACTEVCPVQAGIFGERDDLLKEAESRIQKEPQKYFPHIYGKDEVAEPQCCIYPQCPLKPWDCQRTCRTTLCPTTLSDSFQTARLVSATGVLLAESTGSRTGEKKWRRRRRNRSGHRAI